MVNQTCAICEEANFQVLYKENLDIKKIDEKIFSARRLPDKIHYQIVRCRRCGLIYSTPILEAEKINKLYRKSSVSYDEQISNLVETYGFYLKSLERYGVSKKKLLEIGCGSGFFLMEAKRQGYRDVYGVEPGVKSVQKAPKEIRDKIIVDVFRPNLFQKNYFDVICCFQTLDHVPNPNPFLKECYQVLKKGGFVLFLNHDASSWSAKLFGEASPIIDIEHTYLYDQKTIKRFFEKHRFKVKKVESTFNNHNLSYWIYLAPLPRLLKLAFINIVKAARVDFKIKLKAGNLVLYGQK